MPTIRPIVNIGQPEVPDPPNCPMCYCSHTAPLLVTPLLVTPLLLSPLLAS
jgi:hypothetical protein